MCFVLLITGVGSLIHIYSIGYMADDPERRRFFAYLNLFLAAMLLLVLADNYLGLYVGLGGRRSGVVPADRVLVAQAVGGHRGQEGVRGQPRRRHRPGDRADGDVRHHRLDLLRTVSSPPRRQLERRHADRDRAAAAARRVRQVRPGAAAVLARRRDGGPHAGVGADPRRHHGHRRRVPDRALRSDLRPRARRPDRASSSSARSRCCSARSSAAPRTTSRRRSPRPR